MEHLFNDLLFFPAEMTEVQEKTALWWEKMSQYCKDLLGL